MNPMHLSSPRPLKPSQRVAAKTSSSALQPPGLAGLPQVGPGRQPRAVARDLAMTQQQQPISTGVRQQMEQRAATLRSAQLPADSALAVNPIFTCKHPKYGEESRNVLHKLKLQI